MNHAFLLHISLPSLYDYDLKLPDYTCYGGRKCKTTIFLFLFLILDKVIQDYLQKNRPQIEQGRIVAMKFETARIQVPSDVFAAVFVVLVSQAPYYLSVWEKRVQFSVHVHVEIQIH